MSQYQHKQRLSTITTQAAISNGKRYKILPQKQYHSLQVTVPNQQQIQNRHNINKKLSNIYKYHIFGNSNEPHNNKKYNANNRSLKDGIFLMHQAQTHDVLDSGQYRYSSKQEPNRNIEARRSQEFISSKNNIPSHKIRIRSEHINNGNANYTFKDKSNEYITADEFIEQMQIQKNKRIQQIYNPQFVANSNSHAIPMFNKNKSISALRNKNKVKGIAINKLRTQQMAQNIKNDQKGNPSDSKSHRRTQRSGEIKNSHIRSHAKGNNQVDNKMVIFINGIKNNNSQPIKAARDSNRPKIMPVTFQKVEQLATINQKQNMKRSNQLPYQTKQQNIKRSFASQLQSEQSQERRQSSQKSKTIQSQQNLPFPKFNNFFDTYSKDPTNKRQNKTYIFKKLKNFHQNDNYSRPASQVQNSFVSLNEDDSNIKHKIKLKQLQIFNSIDISTLKVNKNSQGVFYGQIDEQGVRNGKGAIFYHNGKLYEGEFKNNTKEGFGSQLYTDGSQYKGQFKENKRNGKGRFEWSNGQIYDGQWLDNLKHGSGLWQNKDSTASYLGQWSYGAISGFGVLSNQKGQRYEGQFQNFNKEGHGAFRFQNGDRLVGSFRKNQPNGQCQYFWANGDYYKGEFSNGLRHGRGTIKYIDGSYFQGQFRNDKKCGLGLQRYKDDITYFGNFQNDLRHGFGKLSYGDVIYYEGYWLNNVAVIFQDTNGAPGQIIEDQKERVQSVISNRLSTEKLKKLAQQDQNKILKSMKNRSSLTKANIQKFSSKNLLQRLCQPKKRCRCLLKH